MITLACKCSFFINSFILLLSLAIRKSQISLINVLTSSTLGISSAALYKKRTQINMNKTEILKRTIPSNQNSCDLHEMRARHLNEHFACFLSRHDLLELFHVYPLRAFDTAALPLAEMSRQPERHASWSTWLKRTDIALIVYTLKLHKS